MSGAGRLIDHTTVAIAKLIDQGGALYQRRAFSALPLLVRQAEAGQDRSATEDGGTSEATWSNLSQRPTRPLGFAKLASAALLHHARRNRSRPGER